MFYATDHSKALRFGDVLRGFCLTTPSLEKPILKESLKKYDITVSFPTYSVVLSPCCQIKEKMISLTPLISIKKTFFNNPYVEKDLTNINRVMKPQDSVPPIGWEQMDADERERRLKEGITYGFVSQFIYEPDEQLTEYYLDGNKTRKTGYYMIDFRNISKIECTSIITAENSPLDCKILELSIETRKELREKLASFYETPAREDKIHED